MADEWEALCIGLDLAAQSRNLDEVCHELSDAIDTFPDCLAKLLEDKRHRLLTRKAPRWWAKPV